MRPSKIEISGNAAPKFKSLAGVVLIMAGLTNAFTQFQEDILVVELVGLS